jgi:hypothetical protein
VQSLRVVEHRQRESSELALWSSARGASNARAGETQSRSDYGNNRIEAEHGDSVVLSARCVCSFSRCRRQCENERILRGTPAAVKPLTLSRFAACWVLFALMALSLSSGCLPFIVPPARVSLGAGARLGAVPGAEPHARRDFVALRAGLHPLDVLAGSETRMVDVAVGYQGELPPAKSTPSVYGPYLELGVYPVAAPVSTAFRLKAGLYGTADLLYRSGYPDVGVGGTMGALVELTARTDGVFSDNSRDGSVVYGRSAGRWAVGLFGSGSLRSFSDGAYSDLVIGLSARIPFAVGVVCCVWPRSSSRQTHHDDGEREAPPNRPHSAHPAPEQSQPEPAVPRKHVPAQPRTK